MTDFGLERFDLSKITQTVTLPEISADPEKPVTLKLRAASAGNRDFSAVLFKLGEEQDAAAKETAAPSPDTTAIAAPAPVDPAERERKAIANNARLYAGTVLVGWENVADKHGTPIPFAPDQAEQFIVALMTSLPDLWNSKIGTVIHAGPATWRTLVDPVDLGKG